MAKYIDTEDKTPGFGAYHYMVVVNNHIIAKVGKDYIDPGWECRDAAYAVTMALLGGWHDDPFNYISFPLDYAGADIWVLIDDGLAYHLCQYIHDKNHKLSKESGEAADHLHLFPDPSWKRPALYDVLLAVAPKEYEFRTWEKEHILHDPDITRRLHNRIGDWETAEEIRTTRRDDRSSGCKINIIYNVDNKWRATVMLDMDSGSGTLVDRYTGLRVEPFEA